MGGTCVRFVGLVGLLVASLSSGSARAAGAQEPERPRLVGLTVSGPAAEGRALVASVNELLGRLGVRVELGPVAEGGSVAKVSVELGPSLCVVAVSMPSGPVMQIRRVPREASIAVTIEAVAHVIQSSVEELIELERQPMASRAPTLDAPPDAGTPTPPVLIAVVPVEAPVVTPSDGLGVELGAFGSGRSFTDDAVVVLGAGLISALRLPSWHGVSPRVAVSFTWNGPFVTNLAVAPVRTSTETLSMRLLGQARFGLGGVWSLDVGLGAGADLFVSESSSPVLAADQLSAELVVPSAILLASVGVRARVSPFAEVFFALAGELDLTRHTYVSSLAGNRTALFQHWLVRPALTLGFSFGLWEAR